MILIGRTSRHLPTPLLATAMLLVVLGMPRPAISEPEYRKLRFEEDWRPGPDDQGRAGFLAPLKYLPFGAGGERYLTLGGGIRERYEYTRNPAWGEDPQDEHGVALQRFTLHGDLHLGPHLRLFGQILSALENGRAGGPGPVDEDRLRVQNAFADVGNPASLIVRAGRQELVLGSERLVSVRQGPNVRRTFDGVRGLVKTDDWHWSPLWLRPVEETPGWLDDGTDEDRTLWGLYTVAPPIFLEAGGVDLYYLGFFDREGSYQQGTAEETRHSFGLRWWGEHRNWDLNSEAIGQWGRFGRGEIRAWTVASVTGYTWRDLPLRPRLGLSANIASGDRDPADPDLESFNALFPRGNYFSELALLGPRNFFNLDPGLTLSFPHRVTLTTTVNYFWRLSTEDGVYGPSGQLLRGAAGSDERFVGTALSCTGDWQLTRNLAATLIYTRFAPGAFIEETGPAETIHFTELTLDFQF